MSYRTNDEYVKRRTNVFLYFIVVIANLTCFTCGIAFAWSSPVTPKLSDPQKNPMGIAFTEDAISWLVALVALGAAVGPFVGGYLADKLGRKRTFMVSMLPFILSFFLLAFGNNLYIYFLGRFVKGMCVGVFLTVVPMYVGEIAEVHNRGIFGCFTVFFVTIGMLYSFAVGPYISLQWFNVSCTFVGIIFLVLCTIFMPESPSYLILKGRHEEARISLKKLRLGCVQDELEDITAIVKQSAVEKGSLNEILRTKHLYKALMLSMGLMVIQQLTAISVINFYLQMIFDNAGTSLPSDVSAIIIGAVQVLATFLAVTVVEKLGRRLLLLSSTVVTSAGLFILSVYFYLSVNNDVSSISWLPITTLVVYMIAYNIGIGPLAFAVMGEVYLPHVKSTASSLSVGCCYFFSFLAAKLFPFLENAMGTWFAFLFFGIGNTLGTLFIYFYMFETKGKTLMEITERFK